MRRREFLGLLASGPLLASADDESITLIAGGDVLLDRGVKAEVERRGDPAWPFSAIAPIFRGADVGLANLECPLTEATAPIPKRFSFKADPAWAPRLRDAGFTALSLANNHSSDYGRPGVMETRDHLEAAGIAAVGAGEDQARAHEPRILTIKGLRLALVGVVDMALEGLMPLAELPGPALYDPDRFAAGMKAAREQADFTVVTVHWGREYEHRPTERQRRLARVMVRAGADLVIGHHPHVVQTVERVEGAWVFYSVGNLVFDSTRPAAREAILVRAAIGRDRPCEVKTLPVRIDRCRPTPAMGEDGRAIMKRLKLVSPAVALIEGADGFWELR